MYNYSIYIYTSFVHIYIWLILMKTSNISRIGSLKPLNRSIETSTAKRFLRICGDTTGIFSTFFVILGPFCIRFVFCEVFQCSNDDIMGRNLDL